ncbi:hypothetical protein NVSP9465_01097 [Novosphingobium sp. CECT 9465]|nr:hypothetical protein NVSP9465_01097 [Novosphingobium sp. CECT 9465]
MALTLAAYGGGSMLAALLLPRLLDRLAARTVMVTGALVMTLTLLALGATSGTLLPSYWPSLLSGWFVLGIAYAASITPSGLLLRRSAHPQARPAVFAAQFALSHVCWLIAYPLAGQVGAGVGQQAAFLALAGLAALGAARALIFWPASDPALVEHDHPDLPAGHEHFKEHSNGGSPSSHSHEYVIDDLHARWR